MTSSLRVASAGASVTVQDAGRPGYQRFGIAEGGAMDRIALAEGAALLGQPVTSPALELAFNGGVFQLSGEPVCMATSGARMDISVDGASVPWRSAFVVQPAQELRIGTVKDGAYGYLHVSGGFNVPVVLGSCSTHTRAGFGGFQGRRLQDGDILAIGKQVDHSPPQQLEQPEHLGQSVVRFMWGAQAHLFTSETRDLFLQANFRMSARRDRMGARLETDAGSLTSSSALTGISDAVVAGDIQIAGDGIATVLLADRQPTGGYPRIATIITADLAAIAQLPVNARFRFELVEMEDAIKALEKQHAAVKNLTAKLQPLVRDPSDIDDLLSYNLIDGAVAPD